MPRRDREQLHEGAPGKKTDDLLALHLARGKTRLEAAKGAEVSLRTVYNRLANPEFRALVRSYQKEFIDSAYGELADGLRPLVRKLTRLMNSKDPKVQLAAGKTLGTLFIRLGVFHDHDERLAALEDAAMKKGNP